ncbi:MAG: hypothetical protein AAGM22_32950 [Acidobacteriota bacterium]
MAIGLEDLLSRFDGEQPEVALMLVKAPLGSVVSGLADTYGTLPLVEGAPVRVASRQETIVETSGWLAAVEQRDESWVCVYVALGEVVELERDLVRHVGADLSETLSTQAIAFSVFSPALRDDETGEAEGLKAEFEAFQEGETTDRVIFTVDGPIEAFETEGRELPETETVSLDLAHRLFADRGIYVPACSPKSRGQQAWLALWDLEPSRIGRADLFRLRGSSFFEDETLTMDMPGLEAATRAADEDTASEVGSESADAGEDQAESGRGWLGFFQRIFAGKS